MVASRKDDHARFTTLFVPQAWTGNPTAEVAAPATDEAPAPGGPVEQLSSIGVFGDEEVTGRARVALNPAAVDLEPGDILVCRTTDPSWTPLFLMAEALVIDTGGQMSHGAIVARELGVTCVINTLTGTRDIPDGAHITVNGTTGVVTIHATTPGADHAPDGAGWGKIGAVSDLHVERGGAGEATLLLLHGMGGSGAVWQGLTPLLDASWTWVAPDLPGHGHSASPERYTFEAMAQAVAGVLQPGRPVAVLGHSLGGVVALALAAGFFSLPVTAVAGVGIKVRWTEQELAGAVGVAAKPPRVFETREEAADRALKIAGLDGLLAPGAPIPDRLVIGTGGGWRPTFDQRALVIGAPDMTGLLAILADRGIPVTLAAGEHDPMSPQDHLRDLVSAPVVLPGRGHSPHVEDPRALLPLIERLRG